LNKKILSKSVDNSMVDENTLPLYVKLSQMQ